MKNLPHIFSTDIAVRIREMLKKHTFTNSIGGVLIK